MLKQLLLATAIGAAIAAPALAQDSGDAATPPLSPPQPTAQDQSAPAGGQPTDAAAEATVTPPPADALMAQEGESDLRADKLIGAAVYSAEGEQVGSVNDIVFDQDGKIVGVVLKVGGLLGMGGKSVGIRWDEVKMLPDSQLLQIGYDEEQLKVAPDFKTRDAIAAEQELERQKQQPQPAPAP